MSFHLADSVKSKRMQRNYCVGPSNFSLLLLEKNGFQDCVDSMPGHRSPSKPSVFNERIIHHVAEILGDGVRGPGFNLQQSYSNSSHVT